MLPVLWGGIAGSMPSASIASMACSTFSTLGHPEICSRLSPPGRTYGTVM
jgi:hypothetical protein